MTTIGRYRYEIDDNNEVWIWDNENPNENDKPFFHQPNYPDNTPWENREAAEAWVIDKINQFLTPVPAEEQPVEE